jgi:CBS domain containing-hemolysin-like protein
MTWLVVILTLIVLILINAFYVTAEFATVSARRSKLSQLAAEGNSLARFLLPIVRNPQQLDTYIAVCQIGITASSLVVGFYGQAQLTPVIAPVISRYTPLSPVTAQAITAPAVLLLLTGFQVLFGELVPKSVAIQYPEMLAMYTAVPMRWSTILFKPLVWFFNGSGQLILRVTRMTAVAEPIHIHEPQEIMMLFEESSDGGLLDDVERQLLLNSLQLRQLAVRQVMIPRNRMLSAPIDLNRDELLELLAKSPYSRLPLYRDSIDNIVGIIHLKDLLCLQVQTDQHDVSEAMRPVLFVPETLPVDDLFSSLQKKRYHVAIVLDEYGGTSGIVTLEDLIEEIFGEFQDEFDTDITPPIRLLSDNIIQVRGDMLVSELNEIIDLHLPCIDFDTIGGLVLGTLGRVPQKGEEVDLGEISCVIEEMDGYGVTSILSQLTSERIERVRNWVP